MKAAAHRVYLQYTQDINKVKGLKVLPKGEYLCADCTEENREQISKALLYTAKMQ